MLHVEDLQDLNRSNRLDRRESIKVETNLVLAFRLELER